VQHTQEIDDYVLNNEMLDDAFKKRIQDGAALMGTAAGIVEGGLSITSLYGAAFHLAKALLITQNLTAVDLFTLLAGWVRIIDTTLHNLVQWSTSVNWNNLITELDTTEALMRDLIKGDTATGGPRPELLVDADRKGLVDNIISRIYKVRFAVLPDETEDPVGEDWEANHLDSHIYQMRSSISEYATNTLSIRFYDRVDHAQVGLPPLPAGQEMTIWTGNAHMMWDCQRALPHIMRTVAQLVIAYRLVDPAFRTTGRFKDDLQMIITSLDVLAARWASLIIWSKKRPFEGNLDSEFLGNDHPLAWDTRSGVGACRNNEANPPSLGIPMLNEPDYSRKRLEYGNTVVTVSGLRDFVEWVETLKPLLTVPTASETVDSETRLEGFRSFVRKERIKRNGTSRTVKTYHVDWLVKCVVRVQPQMAPYDYAGLKSVKYKFFLESYGSSGPDGPRIDRVPLTPSSNHQEKTISVDSPDVFVATEDDGSFGTRPHGGFVQVMPGFNPREIRSDVMVHATSSINDLHFDPRESKVAQNKKIREYTVAVSNMLPLTPVTKPPKPAWSLYPKRKRVTIGAAFNYGPSGDIKSGYVNLQIWNLDGNDGNTDNAGVLYLVVEETPPADPAATIRTVIELPPLNPTEYWSPGFSSMRPTPPLAPP
jgi:hypothetical protein